MRRRIPDGFRIDRWIAPDGWPHRRFAWAPAAGVAPRGSLLFQAGRADFIEKYLETLDHFHRVGWHTAGFDWRGQGGSGRLLADPHIGHAASLDPLLDDLAAFVDAWRASTPAPHVIVAHSMGGHLALRLLARRDPGIAAAILVAPMLGFSTRPIPAWAAAPIARIACRLGLSERAAWRHGETPLELSARMRNLTSSADRYADALHWKAVQPEIALGPPSWGWLAAAQDSMARLMAPGVVEQVAVPVLIVGATQDRLVSADAIRRTAARLRDAELRLFDDAAHELLREDDRIRNAVFATIDAFLGLHAR